MRVHLYVGVHWDTAIRNNMKLNNGCVGMETRYTTNGYFVKVEGLKDRCVYMYTHTQHAHAQSFHKLLSASGQRQRSNSCLIAQSDHMCLPPFFNRNPVVLKYFEDAVGKGCDNLQPVVEVLKKIEARQTSRVGTPYECPMGSPCFKWSENDWTRRVVHGLQKFLPAARVTYTALMEQTWATDLFKCLVWRK